MIILSRYCSVLWVVLAMLGGYSVPVVAEICHDSDSRKATYIGLHNLLEGTDRRWYTIIPLNRDLSFYNSRKALLVAENIVMLQMPSGGWRKNVSPECSLLTQDDAQRLFDTAADHFYPQIQQYHHNVSTLDNNATHSHIRFLMRVNQYYPRDEFELAIIRGLEYILDAQYSFGGWPQNYPNLSSYGKYVTFNDGAMVGAMTALSDAMEGAYDYLSEPLLVRCERAYDRGMQYILNAQIEVNGFPTGWAQQYLPDTQYTPAQGRIYELPAISTKETIGIIKLLLRDKSPSLKMKTAVNSAINWLRWAKIENVEVRKVYNDRWDQIFTLYYTEDPAGQPDYHRFDGGRFGYDKVVVRDSKAEPIWAQFYSIKTAQPLFSGWDGIAKSNLADIDYERRVSYGWYISERKVNHINNRQYQDVSVPDFVPPE
ncbi:MAG: pectate lyase [Pseudomonadales bacterium]|jgi:PelA/Pel-15E family pectate lyase|uniref:pectate lyase n=1 Tax=unclassified Ketobacter TaxID=2639109 RepID=UPI000C3FF144|nr:MULTISPECIES: pectate lyase [unclassified Ketobacter]MAQ25539.1 pectate lyase [Pseudomonadales bacterium]TNC90427.1 MAG: pectate lyase [Alcanivorax sp.]HAG94216.1 pectate lyase [Gammaproteobacteria bacterium]MBI25759.1 pectate lyase [Pseudomonadales bacterium]RLT91237.1 MAG: pectate lyase [Ketobacter sp. GenoA1]